MAPPNEPDPSEKHPPRVRQSPLEPFDSGPEEERPPQRYEPDPELEALFEQAPGAQWTRGHAMASEEEGLAGAEDEAPLMDDLPDERPAVRPPRPVPRKPPWTRRGGLLRALVIVGLPVVAAVVVLGILSLRGQGTSSTGSDGAALPPPAEPWAVADTQEEPHGAPPSEPAQRPEPVAAESDESGASSPPRPAAVDLAAELRAEPALARDPRYHLPETLPVLRELVGSAPRWSDRLFVIRALGGLSDSEATAVLEKALLQDADWAVRAEAADALARLGSGSQALEQARQRDPEYLVRQAARLALEQLAAD